MEKSKILIGMSGGVDSSVAAFLMQKAGFDCMGATMTLCKNLPGVPPQDTADAISVAERLGIPFCVLEADDDFRTCVVDPFVAAYESGLTPNPCIECNRHLKFRTMLDRALEMGCDDIATGHYAVIRKDEETGRFRLFKAADPQKDQSYFLACLNQEQLSRTHLPLGTYTKEEIRQIAQEQGFLNARRKDSQDICFIPDGDYASYIEKRFGRQPHGIFRGPNGENLGEHKGLIRYTVGQRRGLGIAYSERLFVSRLDSENNEVILGTEGCQSKRTVSASDITFISNIPVPEKFSCTAKIRYNAKAYPADITVSDGKITAEFETPQRGVCPGQSLVLYDGDRLIGGGIIDKTS